MWPIAIAGAGLSAAFAVLWVAARRRGNMALVDPAWAAGVGALGALAAALGPAPLARRLLIGGMAAAWALRLATHLLVDRVIGQPEEGRYRELRARWGEAADRRFFVFFQAQALLALLLSAPFWLAARHTAPGPHPLDVAAPLLLVLAVAGETIADRQLRRFKADPANRGRVCRVGLWRVSRHPNYFFEWLAWCAFALVALPAPHGAFALLAPALMLFLILGVTGVPPTEAQALRSRGDDYRAYQRETSVFFPWFPRRS